METDCSPIEFDGAFDIVDIDVHEKLHHAISLMTPDESRAPARRRTA